MDAAAQTSTPSQTGIAGPPPKLSIDKFADGGIVCLKLAGTIDESFEGKKLAAPETDSSFPQWPLFAKLNSFDPSKVALEKVGIPVREPMLAAGEVDAVLGPSFTS